MCGTGLGLSIYFFFFFFQLRTLTIDAKTWKASTGTDQTRADPARVVLHLIEDKLSTDMQCIDLFSALEITIDT